MVRIELDTVAVPHWELWLCRAPVLTQASRAPSPDLVRIQVVEGGRQAPREELAAVALEIAVNVVRVILLLHKGPFDVIVFVPPLPMLLNQPLQVVDEVCPPLLIPCLGFNSFATYEMRCAQLVQRSRVVEHRQEPLAGECWDSHDVHPA